MISKTVTFQMLTSVPPAAHLAMLVSVPTSLAHSNVCARLRHFILMANVEVRENSYE